jgi:CheY-like chemotaxis protein/HPt (histidine-containing phosphotransfer) domain-containing protein
LRQIITNLVSNAIKFTEAGEVVVSVVKSADQLPLANKLPVSTSSQAREKSPGSPIEPGNRPGIQLHFEVRDTGIGIPAEKLQAIFDPFEQVDVSKTRKAGGTGLGLAICKRLVEMMGGRICVESVVAEGSRFHFTALLGVTGSADGGDAPIAAETLHGLAVLVVDDNAASRQSLVEMLHSWGIKAEAVESAARARIVLEKAAGRGATFPLVLLDSCMPEQDGFTLAQEIRSREELGGALVMMLTSVSIPEDVARCRQLGCAYLTKPVRPSDLLDAILTGLGESHRPKRRQPLPSESPAPSLRPLKILLAEDNAVNRKLAGFMLEKDGHAVQVAVNGKEALAACERESYDVVLMDLAMPEMDGFEATAAIRAREKSTGRHVPIIAMTAHALTGDRERCLEAGMDGYVSKPFRRAGLLEALAALMPVPGAVEETGAFGLEEAGAFDLEEALAIVDGNRGLLAEMAQLFEDESREQMTALSEAIRLRNPAGVTLYAHALKGALISLGAVAAASAAKELEQMGRACDEERFADAFACLEQELHRAQPYLTRLVAEQAEI